MVIEPDVERLAPEGDRSGNGNVRLAGGGVPTRMIVHDNDAGGVELKRASDNVCGVNGSLVERPVRDDFVLYEPKSHVEIKRPDDLCRTIGMIDAQIGVQGIHVVE